MIKGKTATWKIYLNTKRQEDFESYKENKSGQQYKRTKKFVDKIWTES